MLSTLVYINMLRYDITMTPSTPTTRTVPSGPDLSFTVTEAGAGRPALILHGGGGPFTVASIADHLAPVMHTITPTHPGWEGTARPEWFDGVDDLAIAYLRFLEDEDLTDVLVIGSSLGGWIAAELAVRDTAGRISGVVIIDGAGIAVPGEPVRDFFSLDARALADHAFYDPERFYADPASVPPEIVARQRANAETLRVIAGDGMHDPKLRRRLAGVRVHVLVIWGDSDGIMPPGYGRAYAESFPHAQFQVVPQAGHLPHLEQPEATFALIDSEFHLASI